MNINIEAFTGRAQAYAKTRPDYPDEAIKYIQKLVPKADMKHSQLNHLQIQKSLMALPKRQRFPIIVLMSLLAPKR